mmetsp:Transcript_145986/g.271828  ORF Transcript_145986/g.271828 Transcript_145986/m.271828 type:complete len:527 (-) Transcript_145986:178-1758(-)
MEEFLKDIGQELPLEQAKRVHGTLAKILDNILRNPCEPKFRTLRKENKMVAENICISMAAVSLLFLVGFEDWDGSYHCPMDTDLGQMHVINDLLQEMTMNLEVLTPDTPAAPQQADPAAPLRLVPVIRRPVATQCPEAEPQRQAHKKQLLALRAQRHAEHTSKAVIESATEASTVPNTDLITFNEPHIVDDLIPIEMPDQQNSRTQSTQVEGARATSSKAAPRTVFDFKPRDRGQPQQADGSLDDIRRLRQERYEQFQTDPDSRLSSAYMQPPTGTYDLKAGDKGTEGWNKWISDTSKQLSQAASKTSEQLSSGIADVSKQVSQSLSNTSARFSSEFEGVKERLSASSSDTSNQLTRGLSNTAALEGVFSSPAWLDSFAAAQAGPGPLPARFRVAGMDGILVRVGVEKDSQPVEMLREPAEFHALESRRCSDGTLRIRIEEPYEGWISFKPSIMRRVGAEFPDEAHIAARDVQLQNDASPALLLRKQSSALGAGKQSADENAFGQAGQDQPAGKTKSARELRFLTL